MEHRSDQAVSSQDQPLPQAGPRPHALAYVTAWVTAIGALAVSLGLVGLGIWAVRLPLAGFVIGAALADRGAEADFRVAELGWTHVALSDIRVGSETSPDALAAAARVDWRWQGLAPVVTGLSVIEPRLRVRVDPSGRVSAGMLDEISGPPGRARPTLPEIRIDVQGGQALIEAPFGTIPARLEAAGVLGRDFAASLTSDAVSARADGYAIEGGAFAVRATSTGQRLTLNFEARAGRAAWNGLVLEGAALNGQAHAPLDLGRMEIAASWQADAVDTDAVGLDGARAEVEAAATMREDALALASWELTSSGAANTVRAGGNSLARARLQARGAGDGGGGRGGWALQAERFANPALLSEAPSASGAFTFGAQSPLEGRAQLSLNRARLTDAARATLRRALPDLAGAPVGGALARARAALEAAGSGFSLSVPLAHAGESQGSRAWVSAPAEARAASGAVLRLSPLREDAPSLTMALPGLAVHGVLALELSGGGAPRAALLLDALDWAPGAPLDADGTLSLDDWTAEDSSIGAEEIAVSLTAADAGGGRIELRGPVLISGPLGDGAIRNLRTELDLAVSWSRTGWRAGTRSGCQEARFGALEAAGLALSNGAFAICPLDGALVAGAANGTLSGGFSIRNLALNGRMAGPGAQPAHLRAVNIAGRFAGTQDDASLNLQADTPRLSIELAEGRTLDLALRRLSGEARLGRNWSVEGAFEEGLLTDPNLPGSVSAIAGHWRAAPEDGKPVIAVDAGEALLIANRPATDAERPLFNPLWLVNTSGELRAGVIVAEGQIVLAEDSQQIAHFTARHVVSSGAGSAQLRSDELVFGPDLQPYDITERARGLVENVRGPAVVVGDITWTNREIAAQGLVSLNGISLATSTIPIVENVRGEIAFDDLFELTTPPGQRIEVDLVNPGIAVRNGVVSFRLLRDQQVAIESADFEFASGALSMAPTTITLGADETELELVLRNVEAADLLAQLNMPDLAVTGRVEGRFPLLLTRRSAFINDGVLRSTDGGAISYTGDAGANATGAARLAFDALKSFAYDDLEITLDGDLNGEVVSSIVFHGENTGRDVDLGDISPIPGVGRIGVRGVPFAFNVRVTAPFRRLAQTVSSITDPGELLNRAQDPETREVDPDAPEAEIR